MQIPKSSLAPLSGQYMRARIVGIPVVFLPLQSFATLMDCRRILFIMSFIHWFLFPPYDRLIRTFLLPFVYTANRLE